MPAGRARKRMNTAQEPTRFAAQRLSRAEIVAAAVAIADRDGVDAVSMRRVAAALGSGTMSLYRHVASREQLLDLMIDSALFRDRAAARPGGAWHHDLALLAHAQRRMIVHPGRPARRRRAAGAGGLPRPLVRARRPDRRRAGILTQRGAAALDAFITGFTLYERERRRRAAAPG